jgi:hypothetical protein
MPPRSDPRHWCARIREMARLRVTAMPIDTALRLADDIEALCDRLEAAEVICQREWDYRAGDDFRPLSLREWKRLQAPYLPTADDVQGILATPASTDVVS